MQSQNCKYFKNKHKKDTCVVRYQVICSSVGKRGEISGAHLCRFQFYTKAFLNFNNVGHYTKLLVKMQVKISYSNL